jgi:hypothetical protein
MHVEISAVEKDYYAPAHLEVLLVNRYGEVQVKRVFRIFPGTPAVSCTYFMDYNQVEFDESYMEAFSLPTRHWKLRAVSFRDATDVNDNLVIERELIPYKVDEPVEGNLLFAWDLAGGNSFFILKEAPNVTSQINYPGYDFLASNRGLKIPFSGFPEQAPVDGWVRGYTITMGMPGDQTGGIRSLRSYLKNSLNYDPVRYEMVMMNTWGDRGRDGKISETFILDELEAAHKLGISHFQIDDGWQQGLSKNSADTSGSQWDSWARGSWVPHAERFPNGLEKILKSADEKKMELGLWFNPSNVDSYADWEYDAGVVINLYRSTGIRYFKIDGVALMDKQAEINLTRFLDTIKNSTKGEVFFNLDVTHGVRGGYYTFRPYGNLFLENRYTDWVVYYPFHTLRNLWMLSRYVPPERLQIEFLNIWRNPELYVPGDPFAPSNYSFEYAFAVAMAAQPLAWFEATGLPNEAFETAETIKRYRKIQADFHAGQIFPIGEEPSGRSWTGFQSVNENQGYLLVFREDNNREKIDLQTLLPPDSKVRLRMILGHGPESVIDKMVNSEREVELILPERNSYVMYKYQIYNPLSL